MSFILNQSRFPTIESTGVVPAIRNNTTNDTIISD